MHVYASATIYFPWNLEAGDESAIGEQVFIYNLGRVTLGPRVTISHRAHLCAGTHDHTKPNFPLLRPPIVIGSDAWICADAFVGPGVTVGEGAIVGARAVAMKNVDPQSIVVGNPARESKKRESSQWGVLQSQKLAFDTNALQSCAGAIFRFCETRLAYIPSTKIMFVLAVR
ncbi:MAG: putative colanic acid biosynthesis acetyltransferase [Limisphaerales bacterium]